MVELVDTLALGASVFGRMGSIPFARISREDSCRFITGKRPYKTVHEIVVLWIERVLQHPR